MVEMLRGMDLMVVVSEVNMTYDDTKWWVNSKVTKHVAKDRNMFKSYDVINHENNELFLGMPQQQRSWEKAHRCLITSHLAHL